MIRAATVALAVLIGCGDTEIDPALTPDGLWLPVEIVEAPPELPDGIRVRAGSWNLHGGAEATPDAVAQFVATVSLDVLALQESPPEYAAAIAALTPMKSVADLDGRAILSRTELFDIEHVSLRNGRAFTHATSMIEGVLFSIYSVHIGWNVEGDLQARELISEHVALDPVPHLLVAGDFNDEKYSSQNNILEELLADVWTPLGLFPGERISWPSTAFDGSEGSQLIDLIFYRKTLPAIVVAADVVNLSPVLSDHKPVWAELLYPRVGAFDADPYEARRNIHRNFPAELPENLLRNPGAEAELEFWTISGDAEAVTSRSTQTPHQGTMFFTGYSSAGANDQFRSSGSQTIELLAHAEEIDRGAGELLASAMLTTAFNTVQSATVVSNFVRPYDEGEVIIEALDGAHDDARVLARSTSKRRDTLAWHPYAAVIALPPGTRAARYTWTSHRKPTSGDSNDAAFDALYLGYRSAATPSPVLAGNMLDNHGAEQGTPQGWETNLWRVVHSGAPIGLMLFPPQSFSGANYFFLGGEQQLDATKSDALVQSIALDAFESALDDDQFAVRFGGRFRTWSASTSVRMRLEIIDDEKVWGVLELDPLAAAEWTRIEARARIPHGANKLRLVIEGAEIPVGDGLFVDELFMMPERIAAP